MTWHIDQEAMDTYLRGDIDRVAAASVEMHVTECAQCRQLAATQSGSQMRSWSGILDRVQAPRRSWLERLLSGFGMEPATARLIAVTPSMRLSWFVALVLVLGFAVGMSHLVDASDAVLVFGALTPVLPVVGVAFAYGRLADPSFEIVASCPVDRFRLLLLRVVAVTATTFGLSLIGGSMLPEIGFFGLWVLPALALTGVALVLATRLEVWKAASAAVGGWVVLVVAAVSSPGSREWLFGPDGQPVFGLVALLAAIGLVVFRDSFNRGGVR